MCALASVKFLTGSAKALTHLKSSSFRRVVVVGGMGLLPASSSSNDVSNGSSRKLSWPQLGNPSEELEDGLGEVGPKVRVGFFLGMRYAFDILSV